MKKGQICEGIVEKTIFPNKGIVVLENGSQVTVKNCIPGQKISFSIRKIRKGKGEGRLLQVLERSPVELEETICCHFGICGGCTFLSLPKEEQLKLKEEQVKELLRPVCGTYCDIGEATSSWDEVFEGIKESPRQYGYRNKMEFSFGDMEKDGPLSLGMHKRGSFHDIVTVIGCKIVDQDYSSILECVLSYFQDRKIPYFHKTKHEGYLRHLLVRKGAKTGEILIDLITSTQMDAEEELTLLQGMAEDLAALSLEGAITGILHTKNDSVADAVLNQGTKVLYGKDYFFEELLGLRFKITPFSFFQTNTLGAEVLYDIVREYVADEGDGKIIFDLYSGTGTIAQLLAPIAKQVIGVEIVEEAVVAARENAELNGLHNCEFLVGDVWKVLEQIEVKPDFIVLDPPRDGIHSKALGKLGATIRCKKIIYISCKPTSLARDLVKFQEYGYRVTRLCCVDMFPNTSQVETVCELILTESPVNSNIIV